MQFEGLTAAIADYVSQRQQQKVIPLEKELEKNINAEQDPVKIALLKAKAADEIAAINSRYEIKCWLDNAARRAKQISLVTHALKFTHGDARGSSVLLLARTKERDYLSSTSLAKPMIDAVGNAAALDVAKLLQLEFETNSLAIQVSNNDRSALAPFTDNTEQLNQWMNGFKLALADKNISSSSLAKQVYFPVGKNNYHIISPLFASSFTHHYYQQLGKIRFGDQAKLIRETRKAGKYHSEKDVRFINTAIQTFGGSKPQNISQLNSQRGGRITLLSCAPPSWQSNILVPNKSRCIFESEFDQRVLRQTQELQQYLLKVQSLTSNLDIRTKIIDRANDIIDSLLNYAAEIQNLTVQTGWSATADKLDQSQQLWLDPLRRDEHFQLQRSSNDWQTSICQSFGLWLNNKLTHSAMTFGKTQQNFWHKLLKPRLRDFELDTLAFHSKGQAQ